MKNRNSKSKVLLSSGPFLDTTTLAVVAFVVATVAAAGSTQAATILEPTGNEALGIAEFQVNETDSSLVITGLDAQKNRVAHVEVKIGRFVVSDAFAEGREGPARNVVGRRIDIESLGVKLHHESEGYYQLQLPLPPFREYLPLQVFLADGHVSSVLENRGISFRYRSNLTSAATQEVASSRHEEVHCSPYDAHHLGPQLDCQQYSGNEPNGFSMNTCNTRGARSLGCSDTSIAGPNFFSGFYTDLFQCCDFTDRPDLGVVAAEKTGVPQAFGVSPCGAGGPFGVAACWEVFHVLSCRTWCEGSGDNCDDGQTENGNQEICEDENSEILLTWSD